MVEAHHLPEVYQGLLEQAEEAAKDGQISLAEAKALIENAQDGKGVRIIALYRSLACTIGT